MAKQSQRGSRTRTTAQGKQRTREHVIAALSVNYVERLVLKCGYVVQRCAPDYSYDLQLETFDEQGKREPDCIPIQLKATDNIREYELATEASFSIPISVKDYRVWVEELMPVLLILYDANLEEAYWLDVQDYDRTQQPQPEGDSVRLRIPRMQVFGVQIIRLMRERKQEILRAAKKALKSKPKL